MHASRPPARTRSAEIKGNTGESARRRQQTKLAAYVIGFLTLYVVGTTIYQSRFAGMFVPDIETDESGHSRIRRRPHLHRQKLYPDRQTTEADAVLEGFLTLVDIDIPSSAMQGVTSKYTGVTAKFCRIDWKLQEKAPYDVPLFPDLQYKSSMCDATTITVDLYEMAEKARAYDGRLQSSKEILPVPPSGVIFHESRCGSTLLANLLGGFSPDHSRVYAENAAHNKALLACDAHACFPSMHQQLIQDVFYLSGRTTRKSRPQYVFYKFSSKSVFGISKFTEAMPDVPWTYLYRDTVEVMHSNLVPSSIGSFQRQKKNPACIRDKEEMLQPTFTQQIADAHDHHDTSEMTQEEYCATHVAALSEAAIQEHDRGQKGRFVNYSQMPDIVWSQLMSGQYHIKLTKKEIQRMKELSHHYSKNRGRAEDNDFKGDSEEKQQGATPEIREAAAKFASDTYKRLEELSQS